MKKLLQSLLIVPVLFSFSGCSTIQPIAVDLAKAAVVAVAQHYGGSQAGDLASAGLSAAAEVLQGYVNKQPPIEVAAKSPGVTGVGQVLVGYLKDKGYVSQKVVNDIHYAAKVAANITMPTAQEGP
jgi:hypothetical protein